MLVKIVMSFESYGTEAIDFYLIVIGIGEIGS